MAQAPLTACAPRPRDAAQIGRTAARRGAQIDSGSRRDGSAPGEGTIVCARLPLAASGQHARDLGGESSRRLPESI